MQIGQENDQAGDFIPPVRYAAVYCIGTPRFETEAVSNWTARFLCAPRQSGVARLSIRLVSITQDDVANRQDTVHQQFSKDLPKMPSEGCPEGICEMYSRSRISTARPVRG
jgi:hypothetical protein